MPNPFSEFYSVSNRKDLFEVGGGHNQKGVDFQRHWAIMRMFELEESGAQDYLLLFEAIQDVAILDSCSVPTQICVYQIKKERKEWTWVELTALHQPAGLVKSAHQKKIKPLSAVQDSPIGKLYASVLAFKELKSTGRFVSNAGCDLPLADGTNAATSLPKALSQLATHHLELLSKGLETLHVAGESLPDLSRIQLERIALPPDDPGTYLVGLVHKYFENKSPRHAGQAQALVDSLLTKISPLGAKTSSCKDFDDMRKQQGYSRAEFIDALGQLETIPDLLENLETWLHQLGQEGFGFMEIVAIRTAATGIYRRQVMGTVSSDEENLLTQCDAWLASHSNPTVLKPFFEEAWNALHKDHPRMKRSELLAHFALRAMRKCADLT